jgi:hypothetical protein
MSIKEILKLTEEVNIGKTSSSVLALEGGTPTFDKIPFRVLPGKRPNLNTFVVVLRQDDDKIVHYGRIITGFELNENANPLKMQKQGAYGMQPGESRPSEQSYELVRVMEIELLGEIHLSQNKGFELIESQQLPHTGQPVYELAAEIIPSLLGVPTEEKPDNGLHLGTIKSGKHEVPFLLPIEAVARHIAVLGKTGVGKSYAVGVLIEELEKKNIPIISFDVLGDTEQTAKELNGQHIVAGHDGFKIPYAIVGLKEFLAFIPNLTKDHEGLVGSAYGAVYDEALSQLEKGKELNVPFSRLSTEIRRVGEQIKSGATNKAIQRVEGAFNRSQLLTDQPIKWTDLLATTSLLNVYVGQLGQQQRNLVVGASARILQLLRRLGKIPPFMLIVDEAHLFLPGGGDLPSSTLVLREMIRTARHDSIGIVLLTQSPSSMDRQILLTCNTRILFALEPEDLRVVSGQIGGLPEESIQRIPSMARGKAVFTSAMDIMRHPVIVQIRQREKTTHVAETPNLKEAVEKWRNEKQPKSPTLTQNPLL